MKTMGHIHMIAGTGEVNKPACSLVPAEELDEREMTFHRKRVTCLACRYILDYIDEEPERRYPPADKSRYQSLGMGDPVNLDDAWETV